MNMLWKVLFIVFIVCISFAGCQSGNEKHAEEKPTYKATTIVPYLDHAIPQTNNLIYCTTFQIAWNELKNNIIKADISMEKEPTMVAFLNAALVGKIAENDYVALAGFGKDNIVATIHAELEKKFGASAPSVHIDMEEDEILAYAYLFKNLLFATEFEEIEQSIFFQGSADADVEVFGIKKYEQELHVKMGKQVTVLDYQDDLDFILELTSTSPTDVMVLAMVEPQNTLLETFEAVEARIATAKSGALKKDDVLKIPKIMFDIEHSYDELMNKTLRNKGFTEYFIAKADQSIRFRLDQKGALLESEAELMLKKNGTDSRYFVFSQPFMLYLKEKAADFPYLAIWVNNPELLIRTGSD